MNIQAGVGQELPGTHNLRWFVWTIMFLMTTGVLLVTYITYVGMTDETLNGVDGTAFPRAKHQSSLLSR